MIELFLLDEQFNVLGVVDDFTSLQWISRYYSCGEFELHCTKKYLNLLYSAVYVYRSDSPYTGVVEYFNRGDKDVYIKGRFLECLLEARVVDTDKTYTGCAELVMRNLVSDLCITPAARRIERLQLGPYQGLGEEVSIQRKGKTLLDVLFEICGMAHVSFRVRYGFQTGSLTFAPFLGVNRTQSQAVNDWCVFSRDFDNIVTEKYEWSGGTRNFAYVAGEGDGAAQKVVTVDLTGGMPRREIYVEARDIRREDGMTTLQYERMLRDRGRQKLAEYDAEESVQCDTDVMTTMAFDLGDVCTYANTELNMVAEGRVTEMQEVVEGHSVSKRILIGKEQLTIIQKIKRGGVQ